MSAGQNAYMSDPFLGEIRLFPYDFAPLGWALCDGSVLSIAENTALFSLLGTTYGGDGRSTFALPDLRGRVAVSSGHGPGLSDHQLGQLGGDETVTLTTGSLPAHSHDVAANSSRGAHASPKGKVPGHASSGTVYADATDGAKMKSHTIAPTGGGQPHDNLQPYLALSYCIAMEGIFPSRP
jgi:microcystin-dependent protein